MNDLRNQAARLGANYVQHDSPQMGVTGSDTGTTTSTATVNGTAYSCHGSAGTVTAPTTSGIPSATAPPAESRPAPPIGAAGFQFGWTQDEAAKVCQGSQNSWTAGAGSMSCSGAAQSVGFTSAISLKTCTGKICEILIDATPSDREEPAWRARYTEIKALLVKKYGTPTSAKSDFPPECKETVLSCVEQGRARFDTRWTWPTGESVRFTFDRNDVGPALRLIYAVDGKRDETPPAL